jgi:hypothetical protein
MFVTPFMAYHEAFLYVCSLRLHHIVVIAIKAGAIIYVRDEFPQRVRYYLPTEASKQPRKNLVASNPLKVFATAMQLNTIPQHSTITAVNFPLDSGQVSNCRMKNVPGKRDMISRNRYSHALGRNRKGPVSTTYVGSLTKKYAMIGCITSCAI